MDLKNSDLSFLQITPFNNPSQMCLRLLVEFFTNFAVDINGLLIWIQKPSEEENKTVIVRIYFAEEKS